MTTNAKTAREAVGNSGVAEDVVVLEIAVVGDADVSDAGVMVRENVPELPSLLKSPLYVAVMVTGDRAKEEGVNDTEHAAEERLHVEKDGMKVPASLLDHSTVPVAVEVMPVTVAVHVLDEPATNERGEQVTEIVVGPISA